jgi:hypothetical protein
MKVSALIPDDLMYKVQKLSGGENKTECIIVALEEWVAIKELKKLNEKVRKDPLEFIDGYSARSVRELNRR